MSALPRICYPIATDEKLKVRKVGDKFYVVDSSGRKVEGPFDTKQQAEEILFQMKS